MLDLFNNIEMKLTYVLADMEITGIKVDREYLESVEKELEIKPKKLNKYQESLESFSKSLELDNDLFRIRKIR